MVKSPNLAFYRRRAKDLLKDAASGDSAALERFAQHHPDVRARERPADLALHQAQLVIARENGFSSWPRLKAYVDVLNRSGPREREDFLQTIVRTRDLDALDAFVEQHPDAPQLRVEPLGFTALHIAATEGWQVGAERLLAAGAEIDARSRPAEFTPLRVAIGYGQPALALFLLERGADPAAIDAVGGTAMQAAAYASAKDVIRALARRGLSIDVFAAITLDDLRLVRELVERDAGVLRQRYRSFQNVTITPLHLAAFQDSAAMVDQLVALGAQLEAKDEQGRTAIDLALHGGKRKAYERLRAHGCAAKDELVALVGSAERAERIAHLHAALVEGDLDGVARELDRDPSLLNQRLPDVWGTGGTFGASPLHWAAMFGHIELARMLLERGADPMLRDLTYGATPAGWAKEYRRREMSAFLEAQAPSRPKS